MRTIDIVFDGPPGPESGRFVEVESPPGTGISFGEWVHREDGYWALRFTESVTSALGVKATLGAEPQDCPHCGGRGWIEVTGSAHDPRCDGTCSVGCPVPVREQQQCPCGGA